MKEQLKLGYLKKKRLILKLALILIFVLVLIFKLCGAMSQKATLIFVFLMAGRLMIILVKLEQKI